MYFKRGLLSNDFYHDFTFVNIFLPAEAHDSTYTFNIRFSKDSLPNINMAWLIRFAQERADVKLDFDGDERWNKPAKDLGRLVDVVRSKSAWRTRASDIAKTSLDFTKRSQLHSR